MIYGPMQEGWSPQLNVQVADEDYQNQEKDTKKDGENHCQLMVEIYGCVMNHIDLMEAPFSLPSTSFALPLMSFCY